MKTFLTALVMGLCGAVAVTVSSTAGWPTWVMFIAWISYYLFGKTIKSASNGLLQICTGILLGICIKFLAGALAPVLGGLGFPLSVFLMIASLAFLSRIKGLGNLPAWFMGLIILFGVNPEMNILSISQLLIPLVAGIGFAWLNDYGITQINRLQTSKQ